MEDAVKQKVALVLSGGAARGIAHIGVIEELENRGFEITSIAGTSMGALIGGVYASGKLAELKEFMYQLDKSKVFRLVDFTLSKHGLIKGDRILKTMKNFVPDILIEDIALPYAAVAVDLINKEEVVYRSGSLYHAIRASISIPTIFTPVMEENRVLVDGGLLNNLPMAHVKRTKGDIMIAVHVNADIPYVKPKITEEAVKKQALYQKKVKEFYQHMTPNTSTTEEKLGYFSLITKSIELMTLRMAEDKIKQFSPEVLINVSHESCTLYDFYKAEEQVEAGRRAAREVLDNMRNSKIEG
jgi:NTE family protein